MKNKINKIKKKYEINKLFRKLKYWKRPIRWDLKRRLRGGWGDGC
jgi:hypothetical protein